MGNSLTAIGDYAFYRCFDLTYIYVYRASPPSLGINVFAGNEYYGGIYILYVPKGSLEAYKAAEQWQDFVNIVEMKYALTSVIEGDIINCAAGITVKLYKLTENQNKSVKATVPADYELYASTTPDAAGHYRFENLPAGSYIVIAEMAGYESLPSTVFTLEEGDMESNVNFTLNNDNHTITAGDSPTAVEIFHETSLQIYPNPFVSSVSITGAEGCVLQVISANGAVVHSQKIENDLETVHLNGLPQGVYFFRFEKNRKVKTLKMINGK
jgi:hypothetical protein